MPGNENNPNLQPAGASAGTGENAIPPPPGVQQTGGGVLDPTLQAVVNLQTVYNANEGPSAERGNGRSGAEYEQRVQNGGSRRSSGQNPRTYLLLLLIQHRVTLLSLTWRRRKGSSPCWTEWNP